MKQGLILAGEPMGLLIAQSEGALASVTGYDLAVAGFRVREVVDTVGAGDGFAAGVLTGLMEGLSMRDAVRRGAAIGAIQVMSRGDNEGLPTPAELERFMKEADSTDE